MGSSFVNEGHTEWSPFWILPGVAVPIEIYREASNSARQNSAEENTFPQLRLNQWVKQSVRWMPTHVWNQKHTLLICVSWKAGFTVVPFGQGLKDMSPPSKELMKLTLEGRLAHGGRPVLAWMVDNTHVRTDSAGNIKPDKQKSTEKIDGVVATIMALDRAIRCDNTPEASSVYDSRGLLVL